MKKTPFILIAVSLLSFSQTLLADEQECIESISNAFLANQKDAAREFFRLQSRLTLHRLAWAHLERVSKLRIQDQNAAIPRVETEIKKVLAQIAKKTSNEKFKAAREEFIKSPLSRRGFSDALEALSEVIHEQKDAKAEKTDYVLHLEDLKTIAILSELEDLEKPKSSQFTNTRSGSTGILHLVKLINSAYQNKTVGDIDKEKKILQAEIKSCESQEKKWLERLSKVFKNEPKCSELQVCPDCAKTDEKQKTLSLDLLTKALHEDLKKSNYQGVRYGDVWIRTAYSPPKIAVESTGSGSAAARPSTRPIASPVASITPTSAPVAKSMKFTLDNSFGVLTEEEKEKIVPPSVKMQKAVLSTLKLIDQLSPCISKNYPTIASNPLPYARAAAIIKSETKHPLLKSSWNAVIPRLKWYFSNPKMPEKIKSCSPLASSEDPEHGEQILGLFEYWASQPSELNALKNCSYPLEDRLIYSAMISIGELSASSFQNCAVSSDVAKGMKTHRKFMNAIH